MRQGVRAFLASGAALIVAAGTVIAIDEIDETVGLAPRTDRATTASPTSR